MSDTRVYSMAQFQLFPVGGGDPLVKTEPVWWYDLLTKRAVGVMAGLELIPGVGVVCEGVYTPIDTRLAWFTTSGGKWAEARSAVGGQGRPYYLTQYDASGTALWSAKSIYSIPENCSFALSVGLFEVSAAYNESAPPFCLISWGDGAWGILITGGSGAQLVRNATGSGWEACGTRLPWPVETPLAGFRRVIYFIRPQAGALCLSGDFGRTWEVYRDPLTGTAESPAGPVAFYGRGHTATFGIHQLAMGTGVYLSNERQCELLADKTFGAVDFAGSFYTTYGAASVSFTNAEEGLFSDVLRYRATLTPQAVASPMGTFYRSPDVQAVQMHVAASLLDTSQAIAEPFEGRVTAVTIDEPYELHGATASVDVYPDQDAPIAGDYRDRKAVLRLGWMDGSSASVETLFTGYVREVSAAERGHRRLELRFSLDNASCRAKAITWNIVKGIPVLGGLTVNDALDACLEYIGLNASYRSWHANGAAVTLPRGTAEKPFLRPRSGETVWDTMAQIAAMAACELGVSETGVFYTVPVGWINTGSVWYLDAEPSAGELPVEEAVTRLDYGESATGALVSMESDNGDTIIGLFRDAPAEESPGSGRFTFIRRWRQENLPGAASTGEVLAMLRAMAQESVGLRNEPELVVTGEPGVRRRDVVYVSGVLAGVTEEVPYQVLSIWHEWRPGAQPRTWLGLKRLVSS